MKDNKLQNYNFYINNNIRYTKLSDFLTDKYNNIHAELYNAAIDEYLDKELNLTTDALKTEYKETHKIIEIKNTEYYKPSKIIIVHITTDYSTEINKVDLTPYWNLYQEEKLNEDISYIYMDEDTQKDAKIVYKDYVNGKVKMKSNFTGNSFWVNNNYITDETEDYTKYNTFTNLLNNI